MVLRRRFSSSTPNINLPLVKKELVSIWEFEASARKEQGHFSYTDSEYFSRKDPRWFFMDKEMSSNTAGETGAVWIYKGALFATRWRRGCEDVRDFAHHHMENEQQHLDYMTELIPSHMHTKLLSVWRCLGFMVGFLPTIIGKGPALYHTVDAVESFVVIHYSQQIDWLKDMQREHPEIFNRARYGSLDIRQIERHQKAENHQKEPELSSELMRLLLHCSEDELEHKLDAKRRLLKIQHERNEIPEPEYGIIAKIWRSIVDIGSIIAAEIARHF